MRERKFWEKKSRIWSMCEIEVSYVSLLALDRQTTNTLVSLIIYKSSFFFIQCSCCNFSFSLYPHLWRKKLWKFRALSLETNYDILYISHIIYIIDKLFVKIWSNIAPDISGRGAACYCHFQAPGENKNIPSHSRHLR